MHLLLISNSTNYGEKYLEWPQEYLADFMSGQHIKKVLFIPWAGVGLDPEGLEQSYNAYEKKVQNVYHKLGFEIHSIHHEADPVKAVNDAESIAVGGGNTFHLVAKMHETKTMAAIRKRVMDGIPYMGWSAGSNVTCPTLMTTNDMPITEPESFRCLGVIPFQINPHYIDAHLQGHAGETRKQRIDEFLLVNRDMPVAGLREGTLLEIHNTDIQLKGKKSLILFRFGQEPRDHEPGSDIRFLLDH
ncbi:MAG: dipeptidase PepE [Bacteroidales bacterium]